MSVPVAGSSFGVLILVFARVEEAMVVVVGVVVVGATVVVEVAIGIVTALAALVIGDSPPGLKA
jgi:hypothetical protein